MSEDVVNKTCSFDVCLRCNKSCCQDAKPPLTSGRMAAIVSYLTNRRLNDEQLFSHEEYWFPSVDSNMFCIFYDKITKKCRVHEVKPETCCAGPLTFDINLRTMKIEWFLKKSGLCIYAGGLFENPQSLEEHLKVAKVDLIRLIRELDGDDLRVILKREEPETFKIGEDDLPNEVIEKLCRK